VAPPTRLGNPLREENTLTPVGQRWFSKIKGNFAGNSAPVSSQVPRSPSHTPPSPTRSLRGFRRLRRFFPLFVRRLFPPTFLSPTQLISVSAAGGPRSSFNFKLALFPLPILELIHLCRGSVHPLGEMAALRRSDARCPFVNSYLLKRRGCPFHGSGAGPLRRSPKK